MGRRRGAHEAPGRARRPKETLPATRRRAVFWKLVTGRPVAPAERAYAVRRASMASEKFPESRVVTGLYVLLPVGLLVRYLVEPSWGTLFVAAGAGTFLVGASFVLRARLWLRRYGDPTSGQ